MKQNTITLFGLAVMASVYSGSGQMPQFDPVDVYLMGGPDGAAVADFNGDGCLDIATALGSDDIGVVLGNGDGTFQDPQYFTPPTHGLGSTAAPVPGDLNEDGRPDLVVVQYGSRDAISVLVNTSAAGTLSFSDSPMVLMGSETTCAALGDLDGDGHLDVMTANIGSSALGSLSYRVGNGDGTFTPPFLQDPYYVFAGDLPTSLALGDLNGDGKLDVAVTYAAATGLSASKVGVLINAGPGTYQPVSFEPVKFYGVGSTTMSLALGDYNRDGELDVAVGLVEKNSVSILLNNGTGKFTTKGRVNYPVGQMPIAVTAADFNSDSKLDLAAANLDSMSLSILLGNGNGTFRAGHTRPATIVTDGLPNGAMAVGDFNQDGLPDLVVPLVLADADFGLLTILLND